MKLVKRFAIDTPLLAHFDREWEAVRYLDPMGTHAIDAALMDVMTYINTNHGVVTVYSCSGQKFSVAEVENYFATTAERRKELRTGTEGYMMILYNYAGVEAVEMIIDSLSEINSLTVEFKPLHTRIFEKDEPQTIKSGKVVEFRGLILRWKTVDLPKVLKALLPRRFQEIDEEFDYRISQLVEMDRMIHLEKTKARYKEIKDRNDKYKTDRKEAMKAKIAEGEKAINQSAEGEPE